MVVIRDPKTFWFNFDWPKYVDQNLNYKTELIKRNNEPLQRTK